MDFKNVTGRASVTIQPINLYDSVISYDLDGKASYSEGDFIEIDGYSIYRNDNFVCELKITDLRLDYTSGLPFLTGDATFNDGTSAGMRFKYMIEKGVIRFRHYKSLYRLSIKEAAPLEFVLRKKFKDMEKYCESVEN